MAKLRSESGTFQQLSDQKRKVRSIRLTDRTWDRLAELASKNDMTIADYIETNIANFPSETCNDSAKLSAIDALHSAQTILQSKKAAKRSMERLLSAIYGTDLRIP